MTALLLINYRLHALHRPTFRNPSSSAPSWQLCSL